MRDQDDIDDHGAVCVEEASVGIGHHRRDGHLPTEVDESPPPSLPRADVARPDTVHRRSRHGPPPSLPPVDTTRPDPVTTMMRSFVPASVAADSVAIATSSSSSHLNKSRSDTGISDALTNSGQVSTSDHTSTCRLTLSKSTADWTALYK